MSESADYYMSWLGCSAFGGVKSRIVAPEPVVFQPTDLSACSIWLDATDDIAVTTDLSNNVISWSNKGTFGGLVNSNTGIVSYTDTINTLPVLNFKPYADMVFNWTQTVNPVTAFVVMKPITDLSNDSPPYPFINYFDALSGVYNLGMSMYYDSGLTSFGYGIGANNLGIWAMGYNATNPTNTPLLVAMRNDTTSNNKVILNNTELTLSFNAVADYNLSNFNYLLGNPIHGTEFDYGEMIIYERALSDLEMSQVSVYLTTKYDIKTLV